MPPQPPENTGPSGLTPPQERAVRDLLAGARHTDPLPADVAARLDATLGELTAERTAPPGDAVVPLANRKRRRRVAAALLAAAAVVVGGVAVSEVLPQMAGEDSASSGDAAGGTSDREAAAPQDLGAGPAAPRVGAETFRRDVLRARRYAEVVAPTTQSESFTDRDGAASDHDGTGGTDGALRDERSRARSLVDACGTSPGPGQLVVVRYAGERALLVLRPARGGRQVADLYRCGAAEPLRSVELPAR